jgi:hypothetical protein
VLRDKGRIGETGGRTKGGYWMEDLLIMRFNLEKGWLTGFGVIYNIRRRIKEKCLKGVLDRREYREGGSWLIRQL